MALLGTATRDPGHLAALERIKAWTMARFRLAPGSVVMVSQVACALPGCPPLETVVAFWPAEGKRHQFKLFKPPEQVVQEDLPYDWLMKSLAADEGAGLDCC